MELQSMDILKVVEGSALLAGSGFIGIEDVQRELGLPRSTLISELLNIGADLYCQANGWSCQLVNDIDAIERDFDNTYILNSALAVGEPQFFIGQVVLSSAQMAATALAQTGFHQDCMFWVDKDRRSAIFFDLPGQRVEYSSVQVLKQDAERIRIRLAAALPPETIARAKATPALASLTASPIATAKSITASELIEKYLKDKIRSVKQETIDRNRTMCSRFVELMGDQELSLIDRNMVRTYREKLESLPADTRRAAKRYGINDLEKLISLTAKNGDERLPQRTVSLYLQKLAEMFNWAVTEELMTKNPAFGMAQALKPKNEKQREKRDPFSPDDLQQIFGQPWFIHGTGQQNSEGRYSHWRPHYYWMPILGLYTGARLNELAQLYLDDVRSDAHGIWYLDFNLDAPDKLNIDDDDEAMSEGDKSLKTVDALRQIPLHSRLIELGILDYVEALKLDGHRRLFPELHHDKIKGYGKAVGAWFNERFLGNKLKIERNGRKTFHSFRHNFTTALFRTSASERDISQINGHKRGKTESGNRYGKDAEVGYMHRIVEQLAYDLPQIARFQASAGVTAVRDAVLIKSKRIRHSTP